MNRVTAALGASESHTWKIASPGGSVSDARFPFGQPRDGVRGKLYQKHRFASSSFLQKSLRFFDTPALTHTKSRMLEPENYFSAFLRNPPELRATREFARFFHTGELSFCPFLQKDKPRSTRCEVGSAKYKTVAGNPRTVLFLLLRQLAHDWLIFCGGGRQEQRVLIIRELL